MKPNRREAPMRRKLPSGKVVWLARYTAPDGTRRYWKPVWNRSSATFSRKREAQKAIEEAYERAYGIGLDAVTVGAYFETWTDRHPRSERTNETNEGRIRAVLDIEIANQPLRAWPVADLRRRHALELVDAMLREQGRATSGAVNILRALSAMVEDAITDEHAEVNAFKGVRIRANDPRARKAPKQVQVWSFEQMHAFAESVAAPPEVSQKRSAAQQREAIRAGLIRRAMIRVLSDCGLRLGEMLALQRAGYDGETLKVVGNAHRGVITEGDTDQKRHVRTVPVPVGLAQLLDALPPRIDSRQLLPSRSGGVVWQRNFYRDVWELGRERVPEMASATPHEFRHSWVSHLMAAGVDEADLAQVAGHTLETMIGRYTHALEQSHEAIRGVVG